MGFWERVEMTGRKDLPDILNATNILHLGSHRTVNTLRLGYKTQSVDGTEGFCVCSEIPTKRVQTL
jgi:hypothetical protein